MTPETPAQPPAAPPPLRKGRIVLSYAAMTMLGFVGAVYAIQFLIDFPNFSEPTSFSRRFWLSMQGTILLGAGVGVAQWVVIRTWSRHMTAARVGFSSRPRTRDGVAWIVVTIAGFIASTITSLLYVRGLDVHIDILPGLSSCLHDVLGGCVIGLSQWLYLRRFVPGAVRWIAFSAAGEILSSNAGYVPVEFPFSTAAIGVVFGLVQGLCLARLKPGPIAAPSAPSKNVVEVNSPYA